MIVLRGYGGWSIVTGGYGWSEAAASSSALSGVGLFVHSTFVPRALKEQQDFKALRHAFIPRSISSSGGYRVGDHPVEFKAVLPEFAAAKSTGGTMTARFIKSFAETRAITGEPIPGLCDAPQSAAKAVCGEEAANVIQQGASGQ